MNIEFKNPTNFIHILKKTKKNIIIIKKNKYRSSKSRIFGLSRFLDIFQDDWSRLIALQYFFFLIRLRWLFILKAYEEY